MSYRSQKNQLKLVICLEYLKDVSFTAMLQAGCYQTGYFQESLGPKHIPTPPYFKFLEIREN